MRKIGRPKEGHLASKTQRRMSVSFTEPAWNKLMLVKPGKCSWLISMLIEIYSDQFPELFISKKKK